VLYLCVCNKDCDIRKSSLELPLCCAMAAISEAGDTCGELAQDEDEKVLSLLQSVERTVDLQRELQRVLRKGFVELSSAKFSKGLGGATFISPDGFPNDASAVRVVDALEPRADAPELMSLRLRTVLPKPSSKTQAPIHKTPDEFSSSTGIRQRKVSEQQNKSIKQQKSSPISDVPTKSTSIQEPTQVPKDAVYRWLRIAPRNQLKKSQDAFIQSLGLILELAEQNMQIRKLLLPPSSENLESSDLAAATRSGPPSDKTKDPTSQPQSPSPSSKQK